MKTVKTDELEKELTKHERGAAWSGSTTASLVYRVPDSDSKTVNGKKALIKTVAVPAAMTGAEYEKKVNKLREKEGVQEEQPFKSEPPKGFYYPFEGNRMLMRAIKTDAPALMLYVDPANKDKVRVLKYEDAETGETVPRAKLGEYLTPSGYRNKFEGRPASKAQKDVAPEKRFRPIRPYLANIVLLKMQGETFFLEQGGRAVNVQELERELE